MNNIRGKLDGKIILVIGESIVDVLINRFLEEGASVIAVNNSRKETEDSLYIKNKLNFLSIDITNPNDIDALMVKMDRTFGGVDIVCNLMKANQKYYGSKDNYEDLFDFDLEEPFQICHRVIPTLIRRGGGVIINIGFYSNHLSDINLNFNPGKAGLVGLSKTFAYRYIRHGIRCNVIHCTENQSGQSERIADACLELCCNNDINATEVMILKSS